MPHKHTRKDKDASTFDLPPTVRAQPLPVSKSAAANGIFSVTQPDRKSKKRKRNNGDGIDDTPKAFARLMAFKNGGKVRNGLDDGTRPQVKKVKNKNGGKDTSAKDVASTDVPAPTTTTTANPNLTIRPGERLAEFAARVDREMPVNGLLVRKGNKDPLGLKVKQTRKEKKMHKMYSDWRVEDEKIKMAREEALEEAEDQDLYDEDVEGGVKARIDMAYEAAQAAARKKSGKKGKGKKKGKGGVDMDDEDPWESLRKARSEGPRKLNDVAQAPPELMAQPKEVFKAPRSMKDIPKAAGNAQRRADLAAERANIVQSYRALMKREQA